jgi:hypothetical protein
MSSVSIVVDFTINMEVSTMMKTIFLMCLAAGTALLGRSGDMFPKPGEETSLS